MAKGLKLYSFDELDKAAQEVAIEKVRDDYYSGGGNSTDFAEWAVDDDYLFEISQKEKDELFGEGAKAIANSKYGDEPIIGNTRKNIYFDTDRNSHLDASEAIEINNEGMFLTWLGIPKEMQDNVYFTIKSDGSRNADTIIEFQENDSDTEFTAEELSILEDAEQKFKDHMSDVLKSIKESIEYRYSDEAIRDDMSGGYYEFFKSGKIAKGFDDEDTDEMRAGGKLNTKIKIRGIDDNKIYTWTLGEVIDRINQDNATDEFNYDESDWVEGFNETLSEFYSLDDTYGKPLNYIGNFANGGTFESSDYEDAHVLIDDEFNVQEIEDGATRDEYEGLAKIFFKLRNKGVSGTDLYEHNEVRDYINNLCSEYKNKEESEEEEPFVVHGHYTVSNSGGYEVMLSDSGDAARVRDAFGSDNPETSDWLEIEYIEDENGEPDEDGNLPFEPVIDPQGYNIPLNLVMRSNFKKGGNMEQSKAQNFIGVEKYGASDRKRSAKPVGYRYMRIRDKKTNRLRAVTKKDRQYYLTPTASEIKAYEAGDKMARKMIYFERRADHSDKNLSGKGFASGGSIQSLTTKQLAEKLGMSMRDVNDENLGREDLIAILTEGNYKKGGGVGDGYLYMYECNVSLMENTTYGKKRLPQVFQVWADSTENAKKICQKIIKEQYKESQAVIKGIKQTKSKTLKNGVDLENITWERRKNTFGEGYNYKLLIDGYDVYVSVDKKWSVGDKWTIDYRILGHKVEETFNSSEEAKEYAISVLKEQLKDKKIKTKLVKDISEYKKDRMYMELGGGVGDKKVGDAIKIKPSGMSAKIEEVLPYGYEVTSSNGRTMYVDFDFIDFESKKEYAKGGGMKQRPAQNFTGVEKYGSGDREKYAKPVGYRYKKVRVSADSNRLRPVTKDDKKYYQTPTNKDIKAYEAGDKTARKMLYFEDRKDHSDREPVRSLMKFAKGGGVTIGEFKARYQVKFKLKDDDKLQIGYIVQVMTPSRHAIDHYLLFNKSKELVKKLSLQESQNLVNDKKIIKVKGYDNTPEFAVKSDAAVKDMRYSELNDWIEENILPHLKSASLEWRSYEGGSFDINDDKSNKKFLDDVRKSADYSSSKEFEEKTSLKMEDSGWGIETQEGEELEEVSADNSYNWSYLGLMDWNFRVYKENDEKYYIVAHPHMGGDARGNYGDPIFFEDESEEGVLYKFRETVIDGGREVRFTFKDKTELMFSAQQDSDVSYYEYYEGHGGKKIKAKSPAELLLSTFETFGSWNGDGFLESIVDAFISSKKKKKELGGGLDNTEEIKERLEYLRGELREERISQGELIELQSLAKYIDKGDVELLEAAGVPEFEDDDDDDDEYADGGGVGDSLMGIDMKSIVKKSDSNPNKWIFTITFADLIDGKKVWRKYPNHISELFKTKGEAEFELEKQIEFNKDNAEARKAKLAGASDKEISDLLEKSLAKKRVKFADGGQLSSDMTGQSLSNGTLKTEHLIDAFMDFLQSVKVKLGIEEKVNKIQDEIDSLEKDEDGDFVGDSEETAMFILNDDIFDLLMSISPEGTSFGSHEGNGSDFGFWENEDNDEEFRSGGSVKSKANARQKKQQYGDRDVEKYGTRDSSVMARPVGYRYRKVRNPSSGRLRDVNKGDKQYYNSPTKKDIKAYEAGDKTARKMIYYEDRKDHSDKSVHSKRGF